MSFRLRCIFIYTYIHRNSCFFQYNTKPCFSIVPSSKDTFTHSHKNLVQLHIWKNKDLPNSYYSVSMSILHHATAIMWELYKFRMYVPLTFLYYITLYMNTNTTIWIINKYTAIFFTIF